MDNSVRVSRWLRPMVFPSNIVTAVRPDRVMVYHVNVNSKTNLIREEPLDLEALDESRLAALASDLADTCAGEASALGGVQRYALVAMAEERTIGRTVLRVRGEDEEDKEDMLSEPPTTRGQLAQTQRHLESVMRIAQAKDGSAWSTMERIMLRLVDENDRLREKHIEAVILTEELLSARTDRDIAHKESAANIENREFMARNGLPLLAAVVKKYTGVDLPGALPPDVVAARSLLSNIARDDRRRDMLKHLLTAEEYMAFLALMEGQLERETEQEDGNNGAVKSD